MLSFGHRFHRRNQVAATLKKGVAFRGRRVSAKVLAPVYGPTKVAVVVSKKVAKKATSRNRIRRVVYNTAADFVAHRPSGAWVVLTVFDDSVAEEKAGEGFIELHGLLEKIDQSLQNT